MHAIHNNIPLTFLDAPAGTQVPGSVIDAISNYYKTSNANTHGEFLTTNETDKVVATMRGAMAALLGAEGPETISIGQNMTTLNFALARRYCEKPQAWRRSPDNTARPRRQSRSMAHASRLRNKCA
ncbi:MAG: aminotransferase class V-fold PLP-dependent enzyme [Bacteroidota bacterium]